MTEDLPEEAAAPAPAAGKKKREGLELLSQQEFKVMALLAAGWTNAEIAPAIGCAQKTVDTHRGNVLKKLRLRNNSDITRFAIANGVLGARDEGALNLDVPPTILSQREWEVAVRLSCGATNREIMEALSLSVKTVDTHRGHILKKLGLRNNSDITRFAIAYELIGVDGTVLLDQKPPKAETPSAAPTA